MKAKLPRPRITPMCRACGAPPEVYCEGEEEVDTHIIRWTYYYCDRCFQDSDEVADMINCGFTFYDYKEAQ